MKYIIYNVSELNPLKHTFFYLELFAENWYTRVFGVADYESDVRIMKRRIQYGGFKMVDIYFPVYELKSCETLHRKVPGCTDYESDVRFMKGRIQVGGFKMVDTNYPTRGFQFYKTNHVRVY